MSGFLKTLAKIGLVEIDDDAAPAAEMSEDEARRIIAEAAGRPTEPTPPAEIGPPELDLGDADPPAVLPVPTDVVEGRPLEEIYAEAEVRQSPFSAEKLLRLLDGLMVMDAASRRMAVEAMDAADDTWTIEDPILDAQRKIQALDLARRGLEAVASDAAQKAEADLRAHAEYQEKATSEIRGQIAELEQLLQQEVERVAADRQTVKTQLEATRQAVQRESKRLEAEVSRLRNIEELFGSSGAQESDLEQGGD